MDHKIQEMDDRILLLNLYLTQAITLGLGVLGCYFFYLRNGISIHTFFVPPSIGASVGWGLLLAAFIIILELLLVYHLPTSYLDDGGINDKLFSNRSLWHIFMIVLIVSVSEELLFRVVIQTKLGLLYTSLIFAFVHIRYMKKWVMFTTVFVVSVALGWLYEYTGSALAPMVCHFAIDFILALFIRFQWIQSKWEEKA